ncbi:DMT family transporter [Sphingosinicella soli]|uniref:Drug/metabolite transporter (DMT)-like permease n=1 Tax=Sphingosinicella soli TaxID=333708 RepID=A0A7W7AZW4_9SPHN|nr:DMT family transporter [Sphingosinicella soli]MBB4631274.1 drug/metabolite transporter (DMT)-like permease [Sphingosinicella soli]
MTRSSSNTASRPLAGAAWILVAAVGFSAAWVFIRLASETIHPFALVFWRNIAGLMFILPLVLRDPAIASPNRWKSHAVRSTSGVIGMFTMFYAVANAPMATVQAITFAAPIFATAGAALFLGETLRARRVGALLVGFAGILVVLRPGMQPLTPGIISAIIAAGSIAFSIIAIKRLVGLARPMAVVFWSFALPVLPTFFVALAFWTTPSGVAWLYILGIGAGTLIAQTATVRAFAIAEATAVMPYDFVRFGITVAIGALLFGEPADATTLIGGAIILGSAIYLAYREAVLARKGPASAPKLD